MRMITGLVIVPSLELVIFIVCNAMIKTRKKKAPIPYSGG